MLYRLFDNNYKRGDNTFMNVRKNAIPKRYRAFYIEPGLADYSAEGIGIVLVQKPVLDRMMSTFVGMPVVNFEHTDKRPEDLFNMSDEEIGEIADGVISESGYDEESGWYWCDMLIWDKETQKNLDNGYSVSCAYDVTKSDSSGGLYHNVEYDEEVTEGNYIHMAVVPNPRYEKAWVIKNSKTKGEGLKIKFLQKKKPLRNQEPVKKPDEEEVVVENAEDGMVDLGDGNEMSLSELVEMYKQKKAGEQLDNAAKYGLDDEVEVDGEKMTIRDLLNVCQDDSLENAELPQDETAEDVVDETLQNSVEKEKGKKNFKKLKNAVTDNDPGFKRVLNTQSERLDRGKSRYGTPVKQGGK